MHHSHTKQGLSGNEFPDNPIPGIFPALRFWPQILYEKFYEKLFLSQILSIYWEVLFNFRIFCRILISPLRNISFLSW